MAPIEPQVASKRKPTVASRENCEAPDFQPMVKEEKFDVGAALNALIARAGKQKLDLAAAIGVSEQAVQKWIKQGTIARENIRGICLFLGCSADELLGIVPIGMAPPSHSHDVRLDPEIVASTHRAMAEMYEAKKRAYHAEDVARFVLVYEKLALRKAGVTDAELWGAGLDDLPPDTGPTSERDDGVPSKGADKGAVARRVRR